MRCTRRTRRLVALLIMIGIAVLGIASTVQAMDEVLAEDAKSFTRFELYGYLAEKTQVWEQGGVFYSDAGTLQTRWKGQCARGKWSTTDEGSLCRYVSSWGEDSCEIYYHNGDVVSIVKEENTLRAPELQEGNTIDCDPMDLVLSLARGSEVGENVVKGLFTSAETIAFVSGKTVIWGPGRGIYYAPDFKLEKIWDGIRASGRWSVNDEGAVCWHVPGWGPTPCESYYYKGEQLMAVFNGRHDKAADPVEGNKIGTF